MKNFILIMITIISMTVSAYAEINVPEKLTDQYITRMEKQYAGEHKIKRDELAQNVKPLITEAWQHGKQDKADNMDIAYAKEQRDYYLNIVEREMANLQVPEDVTVGIINFYGTFATELAEAYWRGYQD